MSTEITASLVVDFRDPNETGADGAGPDASLSVEVDSREDGLNDGRTTIRPGDPVYYLVYKTDNVMVTEHITTTGAIAGAGGGLISVDEYLSFVDDDEKTLNKPIAGGFSASWIGLNGGTVAQASQTRLRLPAKAVGVLHVTYQAAYSAYVLRNVPGTITRALVFLRGQYG